MYIIGSVKGVEVRDSFEAKFCLIHEIFDVEKGYKM